MSRPEAFEPVDGERLSSNLNGILLGSWTLPAAAKAEPLPEVTERDAAADAEQSGLAAMLSDIAEDRVPDEDAAPAPDSDLGLIFATATVVPVAVPGVPDVPEFRSLPSTQSGGGGNATKVIPLNGNQAIDGLLTTVGWGGTSIDYSFPTTNNLYGYTQDTDVPAGFFALTTAQQNAAFFALDVQLGVNAAASAGFSLEGITNLGVLRDTTPDTDQIRFGNTTAASVGTAQVQDFPGNYITSQVQDNGDVWFGTDYAYTNPVAGSYAWYVHIHEIGHAVGLKHGHDNSFDGPMPANVDSMEYSVMTYRSYIGSDAQFVYNETWGYAQTWMMYDIAALQHMYGADFTTNAGNTAYTWSPTTGQALVNGVAALTPGGNRIFETIWDGGGTDTYDLSNYSSNLNINLTPGSYSTFSSTQLAYLGGGPNGGFARGNVFNALQYQGDARSLIENARGGSGADTITGNSAANSLYGFMGNDTLRGGSGNDSLYGDAGTDTMYGDQGNDRYYVGATSDVVIETTSGTAGGTDTVYALTSFALSGNVEALALVGTTAANATGNTLNNSIDGNSFVNTIRGLAGVDTIRSGNGADIVIGGAGFDVFQFLTVAGSTPGARDTLRSGDGAVAFENAGGSMGDRFDLSQVDARTNTAGIQDFIFGTATGIGRLWAVNSGPDTLIRGNTDTDAAAEFEIEIEDGAVLASAYTNADFLV